MFKKIFLILVISLVFIGSFAGWVIAGSTGPVTIDFLNFSGAGEPSKYLEEMKKVFEEQNPDIKINIETVGFGEYFTLLQTRIAGGTAPDSYELNYENFVTYAKKGVLLDLEPLFVKNKFDTSVLDKNALEAFKLEEKQFGLPAMFSDVVLFYNKDLFDKAGASYPTAEWTWHDEQKAAEKIRALGDNIFGICHPIHFWEFYKVVQQNGGNIFNEDKTRFMVNSPQNVETLQFMVDRVLKSNVMPTEAQVSGMGDWELFKAEKVGMIVTGIWAFPEFIKNCNFEWDIAIEPGNTKKATHFFSNGLVINKDSKKEEQAFKWISFMSASKEAAKIRVDAGWELPAVTYPDVLASYLEQTPPASRQVVFDSLQYLVTPPVIEQFAEMADIMGIYLAAARDGAKTPQEALDEAQKELEAKIKLK
ncbi:MAG: sugar ABC transporter substrate-binding protein [Candidatus Nealsonbacteria bacterium]|nr:MAG: sugar ABC transporter substrate-binding protein [Candidatus Nealsonbacteria bacterium]